MVLGALLVLMAVIMLAVWILGAYNQLSRLKHVADQAWAGVEEFLVRRSVAVSDALSYIAKKGSVDSSLETLLSHAVRAQSITERAKAEQELADGLDRLMALVKENNKMVSDAILSSAFDEIKRLEQDIHLAQRFYNGAAKQYNHFLRSFPASFIGRAQGLTPIEYFELFD